MEDFWAVAQIGLISFGIPIFLGRQETFRLCRFLTPLGNLSFLDERIAFFNDRFYRPHGNFDRHIASICTPLSIKFSVSTRRRLRGLITFDVKIFRSAISNSALLMTCQKGLRISWAGSIIPGEPRHNPSLRCLIFVPPSTHIILHRDWILEKTITGGDSEFS